MRGLPCPYMDHPVIVPYISGVRIIMSGLQCNGLCPTFPPNMEIKGHRTTKTVPGI
jgi:hypothetical protein